MTSIFYLIFSVFIGGLCTLFFTRISKLIDKKDEREKNKQTLFFEAITLLLSSQETQFRCLKKIKDTAGKPIVNGELVDYKNRLSDFETKFDQFKIENQK